MAEIQEDAFTTQQSKKRKICFLFPRARSFSFAISFLLTQNEMTTEIAILKTVFENAFNPDSIKAAADSSLVCPLHFGVVVMHSGLFGSLKYSLHDWKNWVAKAPKYGFEKIRLSRLSAFEESTEHTGDLSIE